MQLAARLGSMLGRSSLTRGKFIEALEKSVLTEGYWDFSHTGLTPGQLSEVYQIYREGVLDGLMPVAGVTAFDISNAGGDRFNLGNLDGTYDSFFDVVRIFRTMKFSVEGASNFMLHVNLGKQPMNSDDIVQASDNRFDNVIIPITKSLPIHPAKSWGNVTLRLQITKASGSRSIGENVVHGNNSMKPIPSYHTLSEAVNIKSCSDTVIYHKVNTSVVHVDRFEQFVKNSMTKPLKDEIKERDKDASMPFEIFFQNATDLCPGYGRALSKIIDHVDQVMKQNPVLPRTRLGIRAALGTENETQLLNKLSSLKGVSLETAEGLIKCGFYLLLEGEY